jgi:hypothetical protein
MRFQSFRRTVAKSALAFFGPEGIRVGPSDSTT